jgi:hypothetical protein
LNIEIARFVNGSQLLDVQLAFKETVNFCLGHGIKVGSGIYDLPHLSSTWRQFFI